MVETILVVALILIIISLTMPTLTATLNKIRLVTAGRDICVYLNYVREYAVVNNSILTVTFDPNENNYYVFEIQNDEEFEQKGENLLKKRKIPSSLTLIVSGEDKKAFSFSPEGTASPGNLTLVTKTGKSILIDVDMYGRVRLYNG
ncbi:MAG: GspH/FimT family protein [Candidatus Omnitrophota bacterium]